LGCVLKAHYRRDTIGSRDYDRRLYRSLAGQANCDHREDNVAVMSRATCGSHKFTVDASQSANVVYTM